MAMSDSRQRSEEAGAENYDRIIRRNKRYDVVFVVLGMLVLALAMATLVALFAGLIIQGASMLDWGFFTDYPSRFPEEAGMMTALVGTCLVMIVTVFSAVPLGIAAGIYLEEYAPRNWITDIIEININNLAGVPSIIYGLLALGLFVYQFGMEQSVATAGLTLGLLVMPIVVVATREALRAVPGNIREAIYAVGASKAEVVFEHVVPYSMGGILTGIILAMSRAIGETAPVITIGALTFIAFLPEAPITLDFPFISFEWLSAPFTVVPIQMFNWVSRPQSGFHEAAAAAGIVLMVMTVGMNAIAIAVRNRFRNRIRW